MEKFTLKNGIKMLYYPISSSYSVSISLNIYGRIYLENSENNGITHFLEHLHFRRLGNIVQSELYHNMDKIGSNLNAETYKEMMRFHTKIRPKYLYNALEIFENILTSYSWLDSDIEYEKKVVLNEICEKENYFDIQSLVDDIMLKDTPFHLPVIGTEETVKKLSRESIIEYKKRIFSKGNIGIVITGTFDDIDIRNINKRFENINIGDVLDVTVGELQIPKNQIKIFDENLNYPCAVMSFWVKDSVSNSKITLLNSILGGGTGSILQRRIREKYGLSYDIYSYIECYSGLSLINIYFSCNINNLYLCLEQIVNVLNEIKIDISDREMEANIPYFTDNMWYLLENTEQLNEELSWDLFDKNGVKTIEERIAEYEQIDKYCLRKVAREIFNIENCTLIVSGKLIDIDIEKLKISIKKL